MRFFQLVIRFVAKCFSILKCWISIVNRLKVEKTAQRSLARALNTTVSSQIIPLPLATRDSLRHFRPTRSATLLNFLFACIFVYKRPVVVYRMRSVSAPATCADNDARCLFTAGTDVLGSKLESVRPHSGTTTRRASRKVRAIATLWTISRDERSITMTASQRALM